MLMMMMVIYYYYYNYHYFCYLPYYCVIQERKFVTTGITNPEYLSWTLNLFELALERSFSLICPVGLS